MRNPTKGKDNRFSTFPPLTNEPDERLPEDLSDQFDARGSFAPGNKIATRNKGKTYINSKASVQKMQQMGLDPIEQLCREYAYAEDASLRVQILNTLIKYGYSAVPTTVEAKIDGAIPVLNITKMEQ